MQDWFLLKHHVPILKHYFSTIIPFPLYLFCKILATCGRCEIILGFIKVAFYFSIDLTLHPRYLMLWYMLYSITSFNIPGSPRYLVLWCMSYMITANIIPCHLLLWYMSYIITAYNIPSPPFPLYICFVRPLQHVASVKQYLDLSRWHIISA